MLRFLKLVVYLALLAGFIWFGTNVELGKRTLFGHIQNIWRTHESQELVDGAKGKVGDLMDRATDKVAKGVGKNVVGPATSRGEEQPAAKPMEDVQNEDRKALRDLIGRKSKGE
jgi:hypothetical protein